MDKKLEKLKAEYLSVPIPKELDSLIDNARRKTRKRRIRTDILVGLAAAMVIFVVSINASPTLANTLSKVPVVKELIKVFTFVEYNVDEEKHHAKIKVPAISGLKNKQLEKSLNEKYLKENQQLYQEFRKEMVQLKENGDGHTGVESGYVIKTDNENILSIGRYVVNTVGSSSTTFQYDTIDKKKQVLLTLPILFKDDDYLTIISENIKDQMKQQMQEDKSKVYWIRNAGLKNPIEPFEQISENQNFYINKNNKLVISFNKYDVAPGYMGIVEFVIPTDIIAKELVGNKYIN